MIELMYNNAVLTIVRGCARNLCTRATRKATSAGFHRQSGIWHLNELHFFLRPTISPIDTIEDVVAILQLHVAERVTVTSL